MSVALYVLGLASVLYLLGRRRRLAYWKEDYRREMCDGLRSIMSKEDEVGKRTGFALLDKVTLRKISAVGGREAHANGGAHEWTSKEAKAAGSKGGKVSKGGRAKVLTGQGEDSV